MSSPGQAASSVLPLTGERTMPGIPHENYWFRRHEVVYQWACRQLLGANPRPRRILDAGCGEGYGAAMLERTMAATVTGLDYDQAAARHVRRSYDQLHVTVGNLVHLPFGDHSFDAAISLQTVEHLWDQTAFVAECARVTAPSGLIVVSTPNRLTFPPGNICHAHELTGAELAALFTSPTLAPPRLVGLHNGERIAAWERRHGDLVDAQLRCTPADWPADLLRFVASLTIDDFVLGGTDLDSSLDLLAVVQKRSGSPRS